MNISDRYEIDLATKDAEENELARKRASRGRAIERNDLEDDGGGATWKDAQAQGSGCGRSSG